MSELADHRAVIDGVPIYTSVSALKKLQSCQTAWWFRYVARLPDPAGAGAQLGTKLHAELEHYYRTGAKDAAKAENVLGDIPRTGATLLPLPGPGITPEVSFGSDTGLELTADGIPLKGFIDLVNTRRIAAEGMLELWDFKFKSDPKKYGTTPAQLADPTDDDGVQMMGYAAAAQNAILKGKLPKAHTARLKHLHFSTKNPAPAIEIFVDVPLNKALERWHSVADIAGAKLRRVARAAAPEDVEGNKAACWAYGGCAFQKECPHFMNKGNQASRLKMLFKPKYKESQMGLLNKVRVSAVSAPAPVVQAVAAQIAEAPKKSLIIDQSTTPDAVLKANPNVGQLVAAILPPDSPVPSKVLAQPSQTVSATPAAPATTEAPKRHRRSKAEMELAKAAEQKAEGTTITVMDTPISSVAGPVELTRGEGFSLYIGCHSRKASSLMPYIEGLEKEALVVFKEQLKLDLSDIRLSSGNDVGFGKWKPIFAAMAKETPPAPGKYEVLALGMDERIDVVVSALSDLAADVVTR